MNIFRLFNKNRPYKIVQAYECGLLSVGDGHEMYYELSGNKNGIPVVVIHGGPGAGMSASKRKFFNPKKYHIINYDQRGCGKSTPNLSLNNNTTDYLVEDLDKLRKHLNIDKWVVCGGSWGSTLALSYAVKFKEFVSAIMINGVFLGSNDELEGTYAKGGIPALVYPEYYNTFISVLKGKDKGSILQSYISLIENEEDKARKEFLLKNYLRWELLLCTINPSIKAIDNFIESEDFTTDIATLELYYFKNNMFMDSEQLLESLFLLSEIPTYITQGRYDMLCQPATAYEVHRRIRGSKLTITFDGHSIKSKTGIEKQVQTANEILEILRK